MKINHLIVGSNDVAKSVAFYCHLFGFEKIADDPGSVGGQILNGGDVGLLILPFRTNLPNPVHFAFEVENLLQFQDLFAKAKSLGLEPRSKPERDSKREPGSFVRAGRRFANFYIFDPVETNVEVLVELSGVGADSRALKV